MSDDAAVARSAHPARAIALAVLWVAGLVVAVLLYLAVASVLAILTVRVGADLLDGIDPFLDQALRPPLGAGRDLGGGIFRQVSPAVLVLGRVIWREPGTWRRRLALDRAEPNGMRA